MLHCAQRMLIVHTTDEHRLCLAILRGALLISAADCDSLLGRHAGWTAGYEAGREAQYSLLQWNQDVQSLAAWHVSERMAHADPHALQGIANIMLRHAAEVQMDRAWRDGGGNNDLLED